MAVFQDVRFGIAVAIFVALSLLLAGVVTIVGLVLGPGSSESPWLLAVGVLLLGSGAVGVILGGRARARERGYPIRPSR